MDGLVFMACALLHEIMHLAGEEPNLVGVRMPGVAADARNEFYDGCWPVQVQSTANFCYALSQRFPSLVGHPNMDDLGTVDALMRTW